jgi:hypothetical protein
MVPPQVPIEREASDKYVSLPKESTGEWDKAIFARVGHHTYEDGPPGTYVGYWIRKGAEELDECSKDPNKPDKNEDAKDNNKA